MRLDKLTIMAQEALEAAQGIAEKYQHSNVDVEEMLLALLQQEGGVTRPLFQKIGADPNRIREDVEDELERLPQGFRRHPRPIDHGADAEGVHGRLYRSRPPEG